MNHSASTIGALALTIASATGDPAAAATVYRDHVSHGTANGQSALPVFDGNICKRPLALANEGNATAFITCDSENLRFQAQSISRIVVYVANRGASPSPSVARWSTALSTTRLSFRGLCLPSRPAPWPKYSGRRSTTTPT